MMESSLAYHPGRCDNRERRCIRPCAQKRMPGEPTTPVNNRSYDELLTGILALLEQGRKFAARSVNALLTSTYWLVGQRLVEQEQGGEERAVYGSELLKRLSRDLQARIGRAFSERNLEQMRRFTWDGPFRR